MILIGVNRRLQLVSIRVYTLQICRVLCGEVCKGLLTSSLNKGLHAVRGVWCSNLIQCGNIIHALFGDDLSFSANPVPNSVLF